MAMIKCSECGNEISDKADKCPNCGFTIKKKNGCFKYGCLFIILINILLIMMFSIMTNNATSNANIKQNQANKVFKIGDSISIGYWTYDIKSFDWVSNYVIKQLNQFNKDCEYSWLMIELTATNNAKDSSLIPSMKLVDNNNNEFDSKMVIGSKSLNMEKVNPSLSKSGKVFFDVPKDRKYKLRLSGGNWSSERAYVELSN